MFAPFKTSVTWNRQWQIHQPGTEDFTTASKTNWKQTSNERLLKTQIYMVQKR